MPPKKSPAVIAYEAAVSAQLARDWEASQKLRAECDAIIAPIKARREARRGFTVDDIAAAYRAAKVRASIRKAVRPFVMPLPLESEAA